MSLNKNINNFNWLAKPNREFHWKKNQEKWRFSPTPKNLAQFVYHQEFSIAKPNSRCCWMLVWAEYFYSLTEEEKKAPLNAWINNARFEIGISWFEPCTNRNRVQKINNNLQNEHIAKMAKFSRGFYILFSLFNMVVWKLFAAQTIKCSSNCVAQWWTSCKLWPFFFDVVVHSKKQIVLCQQRNGHWWSHWCEYTSFAIAKQIYQYNICIRAQTFERLNEKIWTSCVQFDGSHTFFITLHFYLFNIFVCIFFVIAPIFPWKEPSLHM